MKVIISVFILAVASTGFAQQLTQEQQKLLMYVTILCSPKAEIEASVPEADVQTILDNKEGMVNLWTTIAAPAAEAAKEITDEGKEEALKEENKEVMSKGYQACTTYFAIQPIIAQMAQQGYQCVDSSDNAIDFSEVETACSEFSESFNKAFTAP